jgi:hypothetical protein
MLGDVRVDITANPHFWLTLQMRSPMSVPLVAVVLIQPINLALKTIMDRLESMTTDGMSSHSAYPVSSPHPYVSVTLALAGNGEPCAQALAAVAALVAALLSDERCTN